MKTKVAFVEETKMVKKETYIAKDGKEFVTRGECISYEEELLDKEISKIRTCKALDGRRPFNGDEYSENHTYKWFYPVSTEEVDLLRERYFDLAIDDSSIGQWVCIEENDYGDFSYATNLSDCIKHAKRILETLGYSMTVEKVGEADV